MPKCFSHTPFIHDHKENLFFQFSLVVIFIQFIMLLFISFRISYLCLSKMFMAGFKVVNFLKVIVFINRNKSLYFM